MEIFHALSIISGLSICEISHSFREFIWREYQYLSEKYIISSFGMTKGTVRKLSEKA